MEEKTNHEPTEQERLAMEREAALCQREAALERRERRTRAQEMLARRNLPLIGELLANIVSVVQKRLQ